MLGGGGGGGGEGRGESQHVTVFHPCGDHARPCFTFGFPQPELSLSSDRLTQHRLIESHLWYQRMGFSGSFLCDPSASVRKRTQNCGGCSGKRLVPLSKRICGWLPSSSVSRPLTPNSKQWFTTSFLEEGAGKRCSECALTPVGYAIRHCETCC